MKWFRSLAAELFPSWHERRLLKQLKGDNHANLEALARPRNTLASPEVTEADPGLRDRRPSTRLRK